MVVTLDPEEFATDAHVEDIEPASEPDPEQ
jgi:hypothetical protein